MKKNVLVGLGLALIGLVACKSESTGSTPEASIAAKTETGVKADAGALSPSALNELYMKDKAALSGKQVSVKGVYMGLTKQGEQVNVSLYSDASPAADRVLCVFPSAALPQIEALSQKDEISATGTVDGEFFNKVKLSACGLAH